MGRSNVYFIFMSLFALLQKGCTQVFLHQLSYIEIKPRLAEKDFGFSIAYQVNNLTKLGNLLIGAPHSDDSMGHVYKCPMENILKGQNYCYLVQINVKSAPRILTGRLNPKQSHCLGASIVATPDYFLACAPLVSKKVRKSRTETKEHVTGSCFIHNGTHSVPLRGPPEQQDYLVRHGRPFRSIGPVTGGMGWNTIADETNKQILISKPTLSEDDILYVDMKNPYTFASSLVLNSSKGESKTNSLADKINLGYGMAAGNYFSKDIIHYAVSMQHMSREGLIIFLTADREILKKPGEITNQEKDIKIKGSIGTQFGAALEAANVNGDELTDLLVGAPSQCPDDIGYDVGALFIYLGGEMSTINAADRTRVIFASKFGSHFGSAVAATDIDGDSLTEIFVSAPYEDFGKGAVYVLSGYEINKVLFSEQSVKEVSISDLRLTQRIQVRETKTFGYSLKILPDVDENGCNELLVGAIGSSNAILFRCSPAVHVTLFTNLKNEVVKDSDKSIVIEVCVNVTYHSKSKSVIGYFDVISKLDDSRAFIADPIFKVDLSLRQERYCTNTTVEFESVESGAYMFSSIVNTTGLNHEDETVFDSKWVTLTSYRKTETSLQIKRQCAEPKLQTRLFWRERETNYTKYIIGTSETENITVFVKSEQDSGCEMCVRIRMIGVHVASVPCGKEGEDYRCFLPKPMGRDTEHPIHIVLDMSKFTNMDKKFHIDVRLFYDCKSNISNLHKQLTADLDMSGKEILIFGMSQNVTKTDTEIFKLKHGAPPLNVSHRYVIVNNNTIKWLNTSVMIRVENKESKVYKFQVPYLENWGHELKFASGQNEDFRYFNCTVDILPRSYLIIVLTIWIYADNIPHYYTRNGIKIKSGIIVDYDQSSSVRSLQKSLKTFIFYHKEMLLKHKKDVVIILAIVLALIIFLVVTFILFKLGFFERKSKKRLESFKASIRSRNMSIRAEASGPNEFPEENGEIITEDDGEIIDSMFELNEPQLMFEGSNATMTCSDNALLIPEDKK